MYFADLSPYSLHLRGAVWPNVLNVGWLDGNHPYERALADPAFVRKLVDVIAGSSSFDARVGLRRGVEPCSLCGQSPIIVHRGDSEIYLGRSSIWVPSGRSDYVAAPDVVLHYVEQHEYAPPAIFVDAVMTVDLAMRYNAQREYEVMGFWHHRFEEAGLKQQ